MSRAEGIGQPDKMATFWMVLADGSTYTAYRHSTRKGAVDEARRLAEGNPGTGFFVLACIGKALREDPIKWTPSETDLDAEIPF